MAPAVGPELYARADKTPAGAVIFDERLHVGPGPRAERDADVSIGTPPVIDVDAAPEAQCAQVLDDLRQQGVAAGPGFAPETAVKGLAEQQRHVVAPKAARPCARKRVGAAAASTIAAAGLGGDRDACPYERANGCTMCSHAIVAR